MFVLRLNDMRASQIEILSDVCISDNKKDLTEFIKKEKTKPYQEENGDRVWSKSFKKEGPLEWYNLPIDDSCYLEIATEDAFVEAKRKEYQNFINSIPKLVKE